MSHNTTTRYGRRDVTFDGTGGKWKIRASSQLGYQLRNIISVSPDFVPSVFFTVTKRWPQAHILLACCDILLVCCFGVAVGFRAINVSRGSARGKESGFALRHGAAFKYQSAGIMIVDAAGRMKVYISCYRAVVLWKICRRHIKHPDALMCRCLPTGGFSESQTAIGS